MPTGYTAELCEHDVEFKDFVLKCARAFGALVEMRDDPMDAPIPDEITPSTYYQEEVERHRIEYNRLMNMSAEETRTFGQDHSDKRIEHYRSCIDKAHATEKRLRSMIKAVEEWEPPTTEHQGLKDFMLEQLSSTLKYDGNASYYEEATQKLEVKTPSQLYEEALKREQDKLAYSLKHWEEDVQRAKGITQWIKDLKRSLESPVSA